MNKQQVKPTQQHLPPEPSTHQQVNPHKLLADFTDAMTHIITAAESISKNIKTIRETTQRRKENPPLSSSES